MAAIVNGMSLSKLRAFGATYFIFSDYARPAMRLSALMELPTLMVFSHDAMGDGEDGPTHQPVEQLISLRAVPGLMLLRPADANEVVEAYRVVMQLRHQPAVVVVSRQPLPTFDRTKYASAAGVARGAYVMADAAGGTPEIILIGSGSEVALVVGAHEVLTSQGIRSRVVSMPSWDIFEHQPQSYRDSVLPPKRHGAHCGGAGVGPGLGSLCRPGRQGHRHADLRCFGTAEGAAAKFRFRTGTGRRHGQGVAWARLSGRSDARRQLNRKVWSRAMADQQDHQIQDRLAEADSAADDDAPTPVAPPCAIVIFGAAGDLTRRLVMPALYNLANSKRLSEDFRNRRRRSGRQKHRGLAPGPDRHDERIRHQGRRRIRGRPYRPGCVALADQSHELPSGRP